VEQRAQVVELQDQVRAAVAVVDWLAPEVAEVESLKMVRHRSKHSLVVYRVKAHKRAKVLLVEDLLSQVVILVEAAAVVVVVWVMAAELRVHVESQVCQ
jgi:hypothetical protein